MAGPDEVARRVAVGEGGAFAAVLEERLLGGQPIPAFKRLPVRVLQLPQPLEQEGGGDAADGAHLYRLLTSCILCSAI